MLGGEIHRVAAGFLVDQIIHLALAIERDLLRPVPCHRLVAHHAEEMVQRLRFGMRIFDETEAVGAGRIKLADLRRRRVVRIGSHDGGILVER